MFDEEHPSQTSFTTRNNILKWSTVAEEYIKPFLVEIGRSPRVLCNPESFLDETKRGTMETVSTICRSRIEQNMTKFVRQDRQKVVCFALVDDDVPNAFASRCYDEFAILINSAIVPLLWGFWREVLKRSGPMEISLQDLVKPEREEKIGVKQISDLWFMVGDKDTISPTRYYGFWEFMRYGLEFLVDHEFAHIFRGHLSMKRKSGFVELSELDCGLQEELPYAARMQAIELDADYFATSRAISSFAKRRRRARLCRPGTPQFTTYGILENCFTNLCVSLYIIPRFHSSHGAQIENMERKEHPPFFIRYINMRGHFDAFCSENFKSPSKYLENITLFQCELVFCEVTGNHFDRSLGVEWSSDKILQFSLKVIRNHQKVSNLFEDPLKCDFPVLSCKTTMMAHKI